MLNPNTKSHSKQQNSQNHKSNPKSAIPNLKQVETNATHQTPKTKSTSTKLNTVKIKLNYPTAPLQTHTQTQNNKQ